MQVVVNVGPLTSYNSLVYYLGPKLKSIRDLYLSGSTPEILFDLRSLEHGNINISALTALLSISKRLRDFIGAPIPATMRWDPRVQGFLSDLEFFTLVDKFKIFNWKPEGIIGGFRMGSINPNTKIIYYGDKKPIKHIDAKNVGIEKAILKQKIAPNFLMRCANVFYGFDDHLEDIISNTTLELIVNALMHAEDFAFVGLQRSNKRITVSVCDSGIGFRKSLCRSYNEIEYFKELQNIEAIVIASLIQKNIHGLRLAINEILNPRKFNAALGWIIISSFDSEIRWQKNNWERAIAVFDSEDIRKYRPNFLKMIGEPLKDFRENKFIEGYWKNYENSLVGTRITFEIQLNN